MAAEVGVDQILLYDEVFHEDVGMKHIAMKRDEIGTDLSLLQFVPSTNCNCNRSAPVTPQAESILLLAGITFYPHFPQIVR